MGVYGNMNYTIKIKGGQENDIPQLKPRELGYCTDSGKAFIGTETGNKDFFKVINDKIGDGFTSENTITSQMNEKANQSDLNATNTNVNALQTSVGTSLTLSNGTKVWGTAQKINKTVTLYIAVSIALTSNVAICTLPTGFTPLQPIQWIASENASGSYQTGFRIDSTGVITLYSNSQSTVRTYIINVTYVTA